MREEPNATALVRDGTPITQRMDPVELGKADAGIARALADGEDIAVLTNLKIFHVLQEIDGSTAPVARKNETDAFDTTYIRNLRCLANRNDVRTAEALGDVLCHIEAVTGAGPTKNNSIFQGNNSFVLG